MKITMDQLTTINRKFREFIKVWYTGETNDIILADIVRKEKADHFNNYVLGWIEGYLHQDITNHATVQAILNTLLRANTAYIFG